MRSTTPTVPRSHDRGIDVGTRPAPPESLMLIQGPLVLDWRRRRLGLDPSPENGCLQASQPPHIERLDLWLKARVQVPTRPDWFFVKLHAHGAPENSQAGPAGRTDGTFPSRPGRSRPPRPEFSLPLRDRARDVQPGQGRGGGLERRGRRRSGLPPHLETNPAIGPITRIDTLERQAASCSCVHNTRKVRDVAGLEGTTVDPNPRRAQRDWPPVVVGSAHHTGTLLMRNPRREHATAKRSRAAARTLRMGRLGQSHPVRLARSRRWLISSGMESVPR